MSHVTDGDLHAWLDGALDELGDAEAERVRSHLAGCEVCRRRLEEERRIREAAGRILSAAAPDVRLPTLEELRSVAVARESRVRSGRRIQRLAWAASVVVALGTGWMLRGEWSVVGPRASHEAAEPSVSSPEAAGEPGPRKAVETEMRAPSATQQPGTATDASARRTPADADRSRTMGQSAVGAESPAGVGPEKPKMETLPEQRKVETLQRPATPVVRRDAAEGTASQKSASPVAAAPPGRDSGAGAAKIPAAAVAENVTLADTGVKTVLQTLPRTDSVPNIMSPEFVRRTRAADTAALRDAVQLSNQAAGAAAARPAAKEAAQEAGGVATRQEASGSLAVSGLFVLSVTRLDADGMPGGVRVLQLLPSGDTLELVHLPPNRTPRLTDESAHGLTELTIPQPDGWLIARAKLPRDSLQALVDRLGRE